MFPRYESAKILRRGGAKLLPLPGLFYPMSPATKRIRWYVVQCKTREDHRALEHLERQGYSCYRPTLRVEKVRGGRNVEVQESLFPGYLFVQLDPSTDNWAPIRSTRGVIQIVRCNERALPVQDDVIKLIREHLAKDQCRLHYLEPGEPVVISEGAFCDVDAIFIANDGDERVMLLINILQREQTVSFPVASVRKAPASGVTLTGRVSLAR